MSREKDHGDNVERNLHGDEMENVELESENERILSRGLRTRKINTKDREIWKLRKSIRQGVRLEAIWLE